MSASVPATMKGSQPLNRNAPNSPSLLALGLALNPFVPKSLDIAELCCQYNEYWNLLNDASKDSHLDKDHPSVGYSGTLLAGYLKHSIWALRRGCLATNSSVMVLTCDRASNRTEHFLPGIANLDTTYWTNHTFSLFLFLVALSNVTFLFLFKL